MTYPIYKIIFASIAISLIATISSCSSTQQSSSLAQLLMPKGTYSPVTGNQVELLNYPQDLENCRLTTLAILDGKLKDLHNSRTLNRLKSRTGELGGTHILVLKESKRPTEHRTSSADSLRVTLMSVRVNCQD